jgi:hypothetical protein
MLIRFAVASLVLLVASSAQAVLYTMELPPEVRKWYSNPDGSCVQCSIGMVGIHMNVPAASTILWDSIYGPKERGGGWPDRTARYSAKRDMKIFNVTGNPTTYAWMKWAAKTNRFAAIGAGRAHFQTLYGWDDATDTWLVCNNNSPTKIDTYTAEGFKRLHQASGNWVVILDYPPPPPPPKYIQWWN